MLMKSLIQKLALIAILIVNSLSFIFSQDCADPANIFSFEIDGKSYEIVLEKKSWSGAASCAVERGGYLAHIESQAEQDSIYDAIINGANVATDYESSFDGGGIAYVWIGATDSNTEGEWLWDGDNDDDGINFWNGEGTLGDGDGAAVDDAYVKWGGMSVGNPKEPDNYTNQDYGAIALQAWPAGSGSIGAAGEWNDIKPNNSLYFVVEYDITGIDQPQLFSDKIQLFPNPVNDLLNIRLVDTKTKLLSLHINNALGTPILHRQVSFNAENISMDISQLPQGIYSVTFAFENNLIVRKLFVVE